MLVSKYIVKFSIKGYRLSKISLRERTSRILEEELSFVDSEKAFDKVKRLL